MTNPNMPARILHTKLDGPGLYLFEVAGKNHYQSEILQLLQDRFEESAALESTAESAEYYVNAILRSEPTNPHDCNAIAVEISGLKVGYLDRHTAAKLTHQSKRLGFDQIQATCKAKLSGYRSQGDQAANVNVMLDYYTKQMKQSDSTEKPILRFEFQVEYPRLDIDPEYAVVGSNLKFWINPSRPNHVLIYPTYDIHYSQPRTPLGRVPSDYVLPIVRNISTRGMYSAQLAAKSHDGWLVVVELTSKEELDKRYEELKKARSQYVLQAIQKPYRPKKPVQVTFELPAMPLRTLDRFAVKELPSTEQIVDTDAGRLTVGLCCFRTGANIKVDLPVEFLIKIKRLLLTRPEIILEVRELRNVRSGESMWCDAEVHHQYDDGPSRGVFRP
jgi:hypothetical protein